MERLFKEILDIGLMDKIKSSLSDELSLLEKDMDKAFCALETALNGEGKDLLNAYATAVFKYENKCESELFIKGFSEGAKFILKLLK